MNSRQDLSVWSPALHSPLPRHANFSYPNSPASSHYDNPEASEVAQGGERPASGSMQNHQVSYESCDQDKTLQKIIVKLLHKSCELEQTLSLYVLLRQDSRRLVSFTSTMHDLLVKILLFAKDNKVSRSTVLSALKYMKCHLGQQLLKSGSFSSIKDFLLIRTDSYISTRLAMKMCDLRIQMFQPKLIGIKQVVASSKDQNNQDKESKPDAYGTDISHSSSKSQQNEGKGRLVSVEVFGPCSCQVITDLITRQIIQDKFIAPITSTSSAREDSKTNEKLIKEKDDFLNKFIQNREFQILFNNECNLRTSHGLEILRMILHHSNDSFNFEPLMAATEHLIFDNKQVSGWLLQQLIQHFDDIHIVLAAFFHVCHQQDCSDFIGQLNNHMVEQDFQINFGRVNHYLSGIRSLLAYSHQGSSSILMQTASPQTLPCNLNLDQTSITQASSRMLSSSELTPRSQHLGTSRTQFKISTRSKQIAKSNLEASQGALSSRDHLSSRHVRVEALKRRTHSMRHASRSHKQLSSLQQSQQPSEPLFKSINEEAEDENDN